MSRRLMLSPCAPIGGTTCAASATSAVRGRRDASATWATIGQTARAPDRAERDRAARRLARLAASTTASSASPPSAAARDPRSIQTTADCGSPSRSGSGTSVNGPPERWISVETPRAAARAPR